MKNLFLSCAMACAVVLTGINQSQAQSLKPRYGIIAGADLTTLGKSSYYSYQSNNSYQFNYKWRYGFQAGVYADLPLTSHFSITPQILYTKKGGEVDMGIPGYKIPSMEVDYSERYTGSARMNYIDVPVLFAYKPLNCLSIFAGPQVSFLLSQASSFADKQPNSPYPIEYINNSRNGFTKVVVGGNAGIGYNYDKHLGLNLHYMYDFQHISANATERNSGVALTASYLF